MKPLLIVLLVLLAFAPMFLKVHRKAMALKACVDRIGPSDANRSEVVSYCQEITD